VFGKFDTAQLQRGYQVYKEVCSSCHSMNLMSFRNLAQPGGPNFSEEQVKTLAATYQVQDGPNDAGDMFEPPLARRTVSRRRSRTGSRRCLQQWRLRRTCR
jgi:ubiquinol-cytochrome c reductase cytochrome c1 subunit